MFTNIWEDIINFITALIIGLCDKVAVCATFAFSPQLLMFAELFPGAKELYEVLFWVAFALALMIIILKIIVDLVNPTSRDYESPIKLVVGLAKYLIIASIAPAILSMALNIATPIYWGVAKTVDPSFDTTDSSIGGGFTEGQMTGNWENFKLALEASLNGTAEGETPVTESSESNSFLENFKDALGTSLSLAFPVVNQLKGVKIFVETLGDRINPAATTASLSEGILASVLSVIMVVLIFINYLKFLIEMAERYVLFGVLTYLMPLGIAPIVSETTKPIFKKYVQMLLSSIIMLCLSAFFLAMFNRALEVSVTSAASAVVITSSTGTSVPVGGAFLYTIMLLAFLKIGLKADAYLGQMGLSVARTGEELGQTVQSFVLMTSSMISRASRGHGSGSIGKRAGTTDKSVMDPAIANLPGKERESVSTVLSHVGANGAVSGKLGDITGRGAESLLANKNVTSVAPDTAKEFAEKTMGGVVPDGSTITGANIVKGENGNLYGEGTSVTFDKDGHTQTMGISSAEPVDADTYRAQKTDGGSDVFTQLQPDDSINTDGMTDLKDIGQSKDMLGADVDEIKDAYGVGDDGYLVKNEDGSFNLYDENGELAGEGLHKSTDLSDLNDDVVNEQNNLTQDENGNYTGGYSIGYDQEASEAAGEDMYAYSVPDRDDPSQLHTESIDADQAYSIEHGGSKDKQSDDFVDTGRVVTGTQDGGVVIGTKAGNPDGGRLKGFEQTAQDADGNSYVAEAIKLNRAATAASTSGPMYDHTKVDPTTGEATTEVIGQQEARQIARDQHKLSGSSYSTPSEYKVKTPQATSRMVRDNVESGVRYGGDSFEGNVRALYGDRLPANAHDTQGRPFIVERSKENHFTEGGASMLYRAPGSIQVNRAQFSDSPLSGGYAIHDNAGQTAYVSTASGARMTSGGGGTHVTNNYGSPAPRTEASGGGTSAPAPASQPSRSSQPERPTQPSQPSQNTPADAFGNGSPQIKKPHNGRKIRR